MPIRPLALSAALAALLCWPAAAAHPVERAGREVYEGQCVLCHGSGIDGAPRMGDHDAWAPRAERGLSSLSEAAIAGVRRMPPHGGKLDLTDLELRRASAYMVNNSGGKWAEPIDRRSPPKPRAGVDVVEAQCLACHGTGKHGAPRLGDKKAWVERARGGFESLVQSAIHGHGGMPARGGMADLTDAEMRSAIAYLFQASVRVEEKGR